MEQTIKKSFFGSIKKKEGSNLLPEGTHIAKCMSVEDKVPKYEGEVFVDRITQKKCVFGVEGLGASAVWANDRGYVKYDDAMENPEAYLPKVSEIKFAALGITKAQYQQLSSAAKAEAIFEPTNSGQCMRVDTKERVSDIVLDADGEPVDIEEQGPNTRSAWEITGRIRAAMGLEDGEDIEEGVGAYARVKVVPAENNRGEDITRMRVMGPATEDQYTDYLASISE